MMNNKDNKPWTKNTLIQNMYEQLKPLDIEVVSKNEWCINREIGVYVHFHSSNYPELGELKLLADVECAIGENRHTITDFQSLCRGKYGKNYDALSIRKDDLFEGSRIQRECKEVYAPFLQQVSTREGLEDTIKSGEVRIDGKRVKIIDSVIFERGKFQSNVANNHIVRADMRKYGLLNKHKRPIRHNKMTVKRGDVVSLVFDIDKDTFGRDEDSIEVTVTRSGTILEGKICDIRDARTFYPDDIGGIIVFKAQNIHDIRRSSD